MNDDVHAAGDPIESAACLLQARLEAVRESISRELATIPPPVPACDVNFNCLLEERSRAIDELQRLARVRSGRGARAAQLLDLCRGSSALDAAAKAQIEAMLAESAGNCNSAR